MERKFHAEVPQPRELSSSTGKENRKIIKPTSVKKMAVASMQQVTERASQLDDVLSIYTKELEEKLKLSPNDSESDTKIFTEITIRVLQATKAFTSDHLSQFLILKFLDQYRSSFHIKRLKNEEEAKLAQDCKKLQTQKNTLEKLSRELEKKYKETHEENKLLKTTQGEKLKSVENHFQMYANKLKETAEKEFAALHKSRDERNGFKQFLEEYQVREKHFKAVIQTKDSEYSLILAKYDLLNEKMMRSKEEVSKLMTSATSREEDLIKQNDSYAAKLKEAEDTLSKSNELFMTYRSQLDLMTEKLKGLQTEHKNMKSNTQKLEAACSQLRVENQKLKNLCRALQAERLQERQRQRSNDQNDSTRSIELHSLDSASLVALEPDRQKKQLFEELLPLVKALNSQLAEKITGMLLELDNAELFRLMDDKEALQKKVTEAVEKIDQSLEAS